MLGRLEESKLEVVLVPSQKSRDERDKIRAVETENVVWYKEFCSRHLSCRKKFRKGNKLDTRIKRRNVISLLRMMIEKKISFSICAEEIWEIAETIFDVKEEEKMKGE